jgi:acyl carrier protein phosphodiesterase
MNFLAHLWLAEAAQLPLAGAVLGDWLRGALPAALPPPLAASVRLHRCIDAATDRHPLVRGARGRFPQGPRRYAGIVLDVLFDHALARHWPDYSREPLPEFAQRAAHAVALEASWFERAGGPAPRADAFSALLLSYRSAEGIERALRRTAQRLRDPERMSAAIAGWQQHVAALDPALPVLLHDLLAMCR